MSQSTTGDKTEKATPHKLRKAREQGQVARSKDVGAAVGLFVALKLLIVMSLGWVADFRRVFAMSMSRLDGNGLDGIGNASSVLFPSVLFLTVKMVLPLLAVPVCVVLASLFPGGWMFVPKNFEPKFGRLNPANNLKNLISGKHYVQLGTTALKATAIGAVVWYVCGHNVNAFIRLQGAPLVDALRSGANLLVDSVLMMSAVMIAFSLLDAPVQKLLYMREQRMSKQDMKEEHRNQEGRPEVKSRLRQLQHQTARRGIRKMVPEADVVVVNPMHYAVALKYDERKAQAPYVLTKGVDEMAMFIRQVAREHGVEVLELPPLARAIYNSSQVNQQIPAVLYRAVAQVLTYVLQIKAFQTGQRRARPVLSSDFDIPQDLSDPCQP